MNPCIAKFHPTDRGQPPVCLFGPKELREPFAFYFFYEAGAQRVMLVIKKMAILRPGPRCQHRNSSVCGPTLREARSWFCGGRK